MNSNPASMIQNLLEELEYGSETKRRAAAYKLGKLGNPAAIDSLTEALKDSDAVVRQNAVNALHEIETRKSMTENPAPSPTLIERALAVLSHLLFFIYMLLPLLDYLSRSLAEIFAYIFLFSPSLYGLTIGIALKRRSPFTASHALQAALAHPIFPIIYMVTFYMVDGDNNISAGTGLGYCLFPFSIVWLLLFFVGALQAARGKDFTYPFIGNLIKNIFLSDTK
jgi:uncharacterized membrane protein